MKILAAVVVLVVSVGLLACAQPAREQNRRPEGPPDPLLATFDADRNGELSAAEIENAPTVLKKMDANDDGVLTNDELPKPPRPGEEGFRGPPPPREGRAEFGRGGEVDAARSRVTSIDPDTAAPGTVIFQAGYETDPRDGGRPVVLIAAALGVKPEVFRDAFSGVTPARGRGPTDAEARANKQVLMTALGKHGVTNDRLDEVSNYYRYRPQAGELWTHEPAQATAIIKDGEVTGFKILNAGAGYSSPPRIQIAGHPDVRVEAAIEFGTDLRTNGRVTSLKLVK